LGGRFRSESMAAFRRNRWPLCLGFRSRDIWAEVGGVADMECANGYCLPIGYKNAAKQAIRARRSTTSARVLDPAVLDDEDDLKVDEALQRLKQGQSILRSKRNI